MGYGDGEREQEEELGGCAWFLQNNPLMVLCLQDGCIPVQTIPWEVVTGTNHTHSGQKCPQDMKL